MPFLSPSGHIGILEIKLVPFAENCVTVGLHAQDGNKFGFFQIFQILGKFVAT